MTSYAAAKLVNIPIVIPAFAAVRRSGMTICGRSDSCARGMESVVDALLAMTLHGC